MAKAKTASKNSPTNRGAVIKTFYQSDEIVPVLIIAYDDHIKYMSAQVKGSKKVILDEQGKPVHWNSILKECKK